MADAVGPVGASEELDMPPQPISSPQQQVGPTTPADMPGGIGPIGAPTVAAAPMVQPEQTAPTLATAAPAFDPAALPAPQTASVSETRTQTQGGLKIDPVIQARIDDQRAEEMNARANIAATEAFDAKKAAKIEDERARAVENDRIIRENREEQRRLAAEAEMQKVRDAQKALDAIDMPKEDSTGSKIGKAIAIALGSFGAALHGGPNTALQVIDADRAQKLQTWKAQYARAQGKVAGAQNLYAQLRQKGLDDQQAEAAASQMLNERYMASIRQVAAASKAPLTIETAKAAEAQLQQRHLADDQALKQRAQAITTTVTDTKSKTGGAGDAEEQTKLVKLANDDEHVKKYREASRALAKFQDLIRSGADGAAVADFIAGKGGLEQGSFGPNFMTLLKKRSLLGEGVEKLRAAFKGGVDPSLLNDIKNGLQAETATSLVKAAPSIKWYQRRFYQAGIDPRMVTGGETSTEAAAQAGATPAAYQGQQ